ncbi:hypothetical protein M758_12G118500 [Ceratodon purpureus]|nr:hypothetical protein M758_12G118500 [Ceratodon purpureus]
MRVHQWVMLLLVLGVVCANGEVSDDSVVTHAESAKEAVKAKYLEWVEGWGQKYAAKESRFGAMQAGLQVEEPTFMNQLETKSSWTIVVDQKGRGDVTTVQEAVNWVPKDNEQRVIIQINPGFYWEKIVVPKNKPFITFWGPGGADSTILIWYDTATSANGTYKSASTAVKSMGFIARGITFKNAAEVPPGGAVGRQAVALMIEGDMAQFYNCSFISGQDTLYDKQGRHYFKDCYIRGNIDFIMGDGQSYYTNCYLDVIADPNSGSLTAQKRSSGEDDSGFVFSKCAVAGSGPVYLGRAWGPFSRVVFINTWFADVIRPEGWYDWADISRRDTVFYGQYECYGPGSVTSGRVDWAMELTYEQAKPFMTTDFIDGSEWLCKK